MHRSLLRNLTSSANPNAKQLISSLAASAGPVQLNWYSSKSGSSSETNNSDTLNPCGSADNSGSTNDVEVQPVSNQELKRRIEKFYEGDEEALPSVFEAILSRKLTGKTDVDDWQLMKELGLNNNPSWDISEYEEFDSDIDEDDDFNSKTDDDLNESLGNAKH